MTRHTIYYRLLASLREVYTPEEAAAIALRYCADVCRFGRFELSLEPNAEVEGVSEVGFEGDLRRLVAGEPVQYVVGWTEFCDLRIGVRSGVLIPRPETEELVGLIVADNRLAAPRILDIGVGSGAISVALAKKIEGARVRAIDVSDVALAVARENMVANGVEIELSKADIFAYNPEPESLDVVVSNPPYIPSRERATMWTNVVDYEPSLALFVPDESPIIFYERIADVALSALVGGGRLYFELHENYAAEVADALRSRGFVEVEVVADMNSKPRMLRCLKP